MKKESIWYDEAIKIDKKKKGLSLKPYFQRDKISKEEIKKAKENSEKTRKKLEKMGVFGI